MAAPPVNLDEHSFSPFVASIDRPLLVEFWADWYGPCEVLTRQFAAAAARMPEVHFAKVDAEAQPGACRLAQVHSIPTLVLFYKGKELARRSGALPALDIVSWAHGELAPLLE